MNKFISDNIAVFVIIGIAMAAVALGMAIANRKKVNQVGIATGVIAPKNNKGQAASTPANDNAENTNQTENQ